MIDNYLHQASDRRYGLRGPLLVSCGRAVTLHASKKYVLDNTIPQNDETIPKNGTVTTETISDETIKSKELRAE
jgi:hypothetical protein